MSSPRIRTLYLMENSIDYSFLEGLMKKCIEVECASNADGEMDEWYVTGGDIDQRYSDITSAIQSLLDQGYGTIDVWYKHIPIDIQVNYRSDLAPEMPHIALSISNLYFEDRDNEWPDEKSARENIEDFIEFCVYIYEYSGPLYTYGMMTDSFGDRRQYRPSIHRVRKGVVENPFWINIFPPRMVEYIGRDALLTAPAHKITEFGDGSVLLVTGEHPYSFGPLNEQCQQLLEHIGLNFPNEGGG